MTVTCRMHNPVRRGVVGIGAALSARRPEIVENIRTALMYSANVFEVVTHAEADYHHQANVLDAFLATMTRRKVLETENS